MSKYIVLVLNIILINNLYAENNDEKTDWNDAGQGNAIFMDRHDLDCKGKPIKWFQLEKDEKNERIRFKYSCGNEDLLNIEERESDSFSIQDGNIGSLSQGIDCGDKILSRFKLENAGNGNHLFKYSCGTYPVNGDNYPDQKYYSKNIQRQYTGINKKNSLLSFAQHIVGSACEESGFLSKWNIFDNSWIEYKTITPEIDFDEAKSRDDAITIDVNDAENSRILKYTEYKESKNDGIKSLEGHDINCASRPLEQFGLENSINDENRIRFKYFCSNIVLENVTEHTTKIASLTEDIRDLSNHKISCENDKILSRIQLRSEDDSFHFKFECGSLPVEGGHEDKSFIAWDYQTEPSNKIENVKCLIDFKIGQKNKYLNSWNMQMLSHESNVLNFVFRSIDPNISPNIPYTYNRLEHLKYEMISLNGDRVCNIPYNFGDKCLGGIGTRFFHSNDIEFIDSINSDHFNISTVAFNKRYMIPGSKEIENGNFVNFHEVNKVEFPGEFSIKPLGPGVSITLKNSHQTTYTKRMYGIYNDSKRNANLMRYVAIKNGEFENPQKSENRYWNVYQLAVKNKSTYQNGNCIDINNLSVTNANYVIEERKEKIENPKGFSYEHIFNYIMLKNQKKPDEFKRALYKDLAKIPQGTQFVPKFSFNLSENGEEGIGVKISIEEFDWKDRLVGTYEDFITVSKKAIDSWYLYQRFDSVYTKKLKHTAIRYKIEIQDSGPNMLFRDIGLYLITP